ncbi:hypothetical protein DXF96_07600 [Heyndrickxia coagulans]|jgi:hypothetical protein|uniref:hypothetical protein n=1 Tax=Heyndrickxia faecalis TaxID=2824910 RepID=UPI0006287210|nr:hypothetical protein BIZ35_16100 [Heyndrickxia coagulans]AVD54987.1 hypothetical protein C3766_01885 [Heyndrickxia coagulans]AWP35862.1 hypothetical protein CYJ15_02035 [Heyndrickxia coagulans]QDI61360.1 hypothetical protein DXF96_07600 [Heyndrickxia coagulans]
MFVKIGTKYCRAVACCKKAPGLMKKCKLIFLGLAERIWILSLYPIYLQALSQNIEEFFCEKGDFIFSIQVQAFP